MPNSLSRDHLDHRLRVRLETQPVGHGQVLVGGLAGGDHRLAVLDRVGHRLLDQHVLAGLVGADRVLGVHVVGQHDVHGVDVGVVGDAVVRVVRVDAFVGHAVLRGDRLDLVGRTAHQARETGPLGVRERRQDVADRQAADADHRVPEGLRGRRGRSGLDARSGGGGGDRAERGRRGDGGTGGAKEVSTGGPWASGGFGQECDPLCYDCPGRGPWLGARPSDTGRSRPGGTLSACRFA